MLDFVKVQPGQKITVRIIEHTVAGRQDVFRGEVLDLDPEDALDLIRCGKAERVTAPPLLLNHCPAGLEVEIESVTPAVEPQTDSGDDETQAPGKPDEEQKDPEPARPEHNEKKSGGRSPRK